MKFGVATAVLGLAAVSNATAGIVPTKSAPLPIEVLNVSGIFEDHAALTGTLDIQGGNIISADLSISGVQGAFTLDENGGGSYNGKGVWEDVELENGNSQLWLDLVLPTGQTNLSSYQGGALCNDSHNCSNITAAYVPNHTLTINICDRDGSDGQRGDSTDPIELSTGRVYAPEPSTTALLGAALTGLGCLLRRRLV